MDKGATMSPRWYKRCGADFIHGTMMLTLEEKGAYSLCLDLIYDRGAPIPDDARWLSGVCGVSIRKWNKIRERLISLGKLTCQGGLISNSRADFEIVSSELQRRNQAESGAKGGRKRAENAGQSLKNNDLAKATLKPIEEIREDKKVDTSVSTSAGARTKVVVVWPCPFGVEAQHWRDFLGNRKTKHLTNSQTALDGQLADLARVSAETCWPPGEVVRVCAAKGWGSINNPLEGKGGNNVKRSDNDGLGRTGRAMLAVENQFRQAGHH